MELEFIQHKYGEFSVEQLTKIKEAFRKTIFFLLLAADPKTKHEYPDTDVNKVFTNILFKINGLNSLLNYPQKCVDVECMLEEARLLYNMDGFYQEHGEFYDPNLWTDYRKLILDAGNLVVKLEEGK